MGPAHSQAMQAHSSTHNTEAREGWEAIWWRGGQGCEDLSPPRVLGAGHTMAQSNSAVHELHLYIEAVKFRT